MSRGGTGEGSLRRRPGNNLWEGRYYAEVDGRLVRRSVYAKTRTEAARRLRKEQGQRDDGVLANPGRETVEGFLVAWLAGARSTLRPGTHDAYERAVRLYVLPRLGRLRLGRLRPTDLRALYGEMLAAGLSPKTVRNLHGILHKALGTAVKDGLLARNPADAVEAPRVPRREMRALTSEQVRRVLEAAQGDQLEALYVLALTTGLRQGELCALRWQDVDLEGATLRVVASLQQLPGQPPRLVEPKTARARRQVALSAAAVAALGRHRVAQGTVLPTAFVFPGRQGGPMSADRAWSGWRALAVRAGVPVVRFHDLRHSAASLMLERGVHPKLVSEMLGHATTGITLDVYSHATPVMHREAARAMDDLLAGGGS